MHHYEVAPTKIVRAGSDTFTYSSENVLALGQVVTIAIGKRTMVGVIMSERVSAPSYDVKPVTKLVDDAIVPTHLRELALWMSEYYKTPLSSVLTTFLPAGIEKNRRVKVASLSEDISTRTQFVLNDEQATAVQKIAASLAGTSVLHGITGSGKTAVYIELAKQALAAGKSAIILVPEIALTSQLVQEFSSRLPNILLTHSKQTESERHATWLNAVTSKIPLVAIGPRSALFLPVPNLGVIVIDESHEPSYKQDQSPRYHAVVTASQLARLTQSHLVLGSATPSITDYYLAHFAKRPIITLASLASNRAVKPTVQLVDMTKRTHFSKHRFLSNQLLAAAEETLAAGKQLLLFHNRRGSTSMTLCTSCGWQAGCPRCFIPLTLHADTHNLRCHICNFTSTVPTHCPVCSSIDIIHKGIGTKLIESEIRRLFPKQTIARFDGDTDNKETVDARYKELKNGDIDIIIGTQVIAKGLDLPELRTVGIVQADAGLSLPDYASTERAFQLLAQAVGRVGRFEHETNVIVQSYQPTHPAVTNGLAQNYAGFYEYALKQRQRANFPPFTYLLQLTCVYKTERSAVAAAKKLANSIRASAPADVTVLGPTPAFYERVRDTYRWQLTVKSPKRAHLQTIVTTLPPQHWQFELDPVSLL